VHPQFASFGCFVGQINIVRRGRGTTREPRVLPMRINRAIRGCAVESAVPSGVLELMRWGQRTLQHLYSKTRVPHALGTKAISADDLHVQSFAGMAECYTRAQWIIRVASRSSRSDRLQIASLYRLLSRTPRNSTYHRDHLPCIP